jgi:hypothetical protein
VKRRSRNLTLEQRVAQTAAARAARGAPKGTVLLVVRARVPEALANAVNALTPAERGEILYRYLAAPGAEATIATMAAIKPAAETILNDNDVKTVTARAAYELYGTLAEVVMMQLADTMTTAGARYGWPPAKVDDDSQGGYRAILEFPVIEHTGAHVGSQGPSITIWLSKEGLCLSDSRGFGDDVWLDCPAELLQAITLST